MGLGDRVPPRHRERRMSLTLTPITLREDDE